MQNMMWAYLIQLSDNMWGDPGGTRKYVEFREELTVDDTVWRQTMELLPSQGINMTAPWRSTTSSERSALLHDAVQFGEGIQAVYPECWKGGTI